MKRISILAFFICALSLTAFAKGKKPIAFDDLPNNVKEVVLKNFDAKQIQYITTEHKFRRHEYAFMMNDNTKIAYDKKAQLCEIKNKQGVPTSFLPEAISEYIAKTFPNAKVTEYQKKKSRQEVELNNQLDLIFNKRGKFLRLED